MTLPLRMLHVPAYHWGALLDRLDVVQGDEESRYSSVARPAPGQQTSVLPDDSNAKAPSGAPAGMPMAGPIPRGSSRAQENGSLAAKPAWANAGQSVAAVSGRCVAVAPFMRSVHVVHMPGCPVRTHVHAGTRPHAPTDPT